MLNTAEARGVLLGQRLHSVRFEVGIERINDYCGEKHLHKSQKLLYAGA
jgi:hypothetical protein